MDETDNAALSADGHGCRRAYVVTGAFGFIGRHIAERLIARQSIVRTLTNHPRQTALRRRIEVRPLSFDRPSVLAAAMRGAEVLINTYWIRHPVGGTGFETAVQNSGELLAAAKSAGVRRIVHVSITNPSETSPFGYFRGKALVERAIVESGLSYAILRPAVVFGDEGVLCNNIAWALRHVPVFGLFGDGSYRLQPIFVDDLAELAVGAAEEAGNKTIDAVGPETFTYRGLVKAIARAIQARRAIVRMPPEAARAMVWSLGKLLGDQIVTREEMLAMMAGLLCTASEPAGQTPLTEWLATHGSQLGRRYLNDTARRG